MSWALPASPVSGPKGWYYELGIAPSYTFLPKATYPITFAVLFWSASVIRGGFYGNNNFGYFSAGPMHLRTARVHPVRVRFLDPDRRLHLLLRRHHRPRR